MYLIMTKRGFPNDLEQFLDEGFSSISLESLKRLI